MGVKNKQANEKFLLQQIKKGNKKAFDKLYDIYWEEAYFHAYKLLKNPDIAKDIVQDVFVQIWIKRERDIENFAGYIYVAVRNRVFKQLEKQKKTLPFLDKLQDLRTANEQQPEESVPWEEFIKAYEAILPTLPEKRQKIFRLRYHKEMTTKAIAGEMGITRKTVQNQLRKAVIQLRAALLQFFIFLIIIFYNY